MLLLLPLLLLAVYGKVLPICWDVCGSGRRKEISRQLSSESAGAGDNDDDDDVDDNGLGDVAKSRLSVEATTEKINAN